MKFDPVFASVSAGILVLVLLLYAFRLWRGNTSRSLLFSDLNRIAPANSSIRSKTRWVLRLLRILALISLLVAFSRPQKGLEVVKSAKKGIAIQMVIDRSSSMSEPLVFRGAEQTRLDVVKKVFLEFLLGNEEDLTGRPNDMVGLLSFAGFVEENAPLTLDHKSLGSFAKTIETANRIEDGTMIGDAIYYAALKLISVDELLRKGDEQDEGYQVQSKIIILLTDGQQTQGGIDPVEAAEFALENKIKLYTVAIVGDEKDRVPKGLFDRFFLGNRPPLDTRLIQRAAEITGGTFSKATSGEKLIEIYRTIDNLEKTEFEERFTVYKERFAWFVALGFLLLLTEVLLAQTLYRKIP